MSIVHASYGLNKPLYPYDFNNVILERRALQIKSPFFIEVSNIHDFGRLVCAFERTPLLTFSFKSGKDDLLATQIDFLNNIPVIYYVKHSCGAGQYLGYRNNSGIEDVSIVENIQNPSVVYSPIISVEKFPTIFWRRPKGAKNMNYAPIKLSNFQSLVKIASYKMIYEESPLPLFVFKSTKSNYIVGTALNMAESDGVSYFYYAAIPENPKYSFIRYSSLKSEDPTFTNNIGEHGYIYIKLIKLLGSHPLVKVDE